jgi:hypothetical protein
LIEGGHEAINEGLRTDDWNIRLNYVTLLASRATYKRKWSGYLTSAYTWSSGRTHNYVEYLTSRHSDFLPNSKSRGKS